MLDRMCVGVEIKHIPAEHSAASSGAFFVRPSGVRYLGDDGRCFVAVTCVSTSVAVVRCLVQWFLRLFGVIVKLF